MREAFGSFGKGRIAARLAAFAIASLCAALCLAAAPLQEAHAYSYVQTDTGRVFNRHWIRADSSGLAEFVAADPHGPRFYMPSFDGGPAGWNGRVSGVDFPLYNATDGRGWTSCWGSPWSGTRGGANFGHGVTDTNREAEANGAGWGCLATYAYRYAKSGFFTGENGLDDLYYSHMYVHTEGDGWGGFANSYGGAADFWPRVRIVYDKNTTAAVANLPAAHYKYMGNAANVSSAKPTRAGYTFEGWSLSKGGPVNVASGQRIGCEDWNLLKHMDVPHGWNDGFADIYPDAGGGIPSPTGKNVITLYAQWKPVSYTVAYDGNGATAGSTASSSHVYDSPKALTANGYKRSYALSCYAQGGSAGDRTLACAWAWRAWNAKADGAGASYADRASVKNLRSSAGTATLYAQWDPGSVVLPDPGTKEGCVFEGWRTAPDGGTLLGWPGDAVSISSDTACYAQWRRLAPVSYFADGEADPVFQESVEPNAAYMANARAAAAAAKEGCDGFDGWYVDEECSVRFEDGTPVPAEGLRLYGRNRVTVSYGMTDRSRELLAGRDLFSDEALSTSVETDGLLPAPLSCFYGDRVSFARGPSAWFFERGRAREAVCGPGAYATASAEGASALSARITRSTTVYLDWGAPAYDGIAVF